MNESDTQYEAMVWEMNERGYEDPKLDEEAKVVSDILRGLTWQDTAPIEQRLGNVGGMVAYLKSRQLPASPGLAKQELALVGALLEIEKRGRALRGPEPEGFAAEMAFAEERCRSEELLFVVTADFFELVGWLDEPWPLDGAPKGGAR
ncbi:MAG: hypothetical protein ACYDCL_06125 [Myxococcales bacterium]